MNTFYNTIPTNFHQIDESIIWNSYRKRLFKFQKYIIIFGLITLLDIIVYFSYWIHEDEIFNRYIILTFVIPFLFIYILTVITKQDNKLTNLVKITFFSTVLFLIIIKVYIITLLTQNKILYTILMSIGICLQMVLSCLIIFS